VELLVPERMRRGHGRLRDVFTAETLTRRTEIGLTDRLPQNRTEFPVDGVNEVLTVEENQLEQVPGAGTALINAIATLGERLIVLLDPSTIFTTSQLAA
jgi:chemotaxis signal transduction protein